MCSDLCKAGPWCSSEQQTALVSVENGDNVLLHSWYWRSVHGDRGQRSIIYTVCQLWKEIAQVGPEFIATLGCADNCAWKSEYTECLNTCTDGKPLVSTGGALLFSAQLTKWCGPWDGDNHWAGDNHCWDSPCQHKPAAKLNSHRHTSPLCQGL